MKNIKIVIQLLFLSSIVLILACNVLKEKEHQGINETEQSKKVRSINPRAPVETSQFGQLVGEWECISRDLDTSDENNEKWYINKAKWKWEYVLGGHALLNNWWQEDNSPNAEVKEYFATGIFIFNPKTKLWEIVVLNSKPHKISPKFQAEYKNETIQMHDRSGKWLVTFFDIKKNSFQWKYEVFTEEGTWKSISEISAVRNR